MPFYVINQPQEKLKQFLNRRVSNQSFNQSQPVNDFFIRSKYDSRRRLRKSKRFNTSLGEHCDVDFRIQTCYQPSIEYKFTGEYFKTKYCQSRDSLNTTTKQQNYEKFKQIHKTQNLILNCQTKENEIDKKIDNVVNEEFDLTKSFLITLQKEQSPLKNRCKSLKSQMKFLVRHPTPVKEAQFLVKMKKDFVKRHRPNKKEKKSIHRNDLIKIEDYISQKKQSFKRHMQTQLIRVGQAKLLSRIEERKGKIYLGGLHNAGKKKKSVENIDDLLRRSRGSFSTPNNLISHLKLTSQKKNKLENIRKLKQRTMDNCLQRIKSMNIKSEMISSTMKGT